MNKIGYGWSWAFKNWNNGKLEICHWAEPDRQRLAENGKPTPDATAIYVAIVPIKLWRSLSARRKNTNAPKRKRK